MPEPPPRLYESDKVYQQRLTAWRAKKACEQPPAREGMRRAAKIVRRAGFLEAAALIEAEIKE